jgi:hypothetical protein
MNARVRSAAAAVFAVVAAGVPAALQAQAVLRGRVVDESTGAPIVGVHVLLLDADGRRVMSVLANEQGAFQLQRVRAGTFRLRAELIGRQSTQSDPFQVRDGVVRDFTLRLPVAPVDMPGLEVSATQKCVAREGTTRQTQTVWEEARKALSIESAVREQGLYRFDMVRYERDVDETGHITRENNLFFTRYTGETFVSRPPEELATNGYHVRDGDVHNLLGPNSDVLLSDPFLDTHCFYLRRDTDRPGEIGLVFEPLPGRRVTDIQGVLWLDERSAALRSLEFSYTRMPVVLPDGHYGGTAEFQRLRNGAFIVSRWEIFSPITQREELTYREMRIATERVVGTRSEGGEVINIVDRNGRTLESTSRAGLAAGTAYGSTYAQGTIVGRVIDAASGAVMPGVAVTLRNTGRRLLTREDGRFAFTQLGAGVHTLDFEFIGFASRSDSLRLERDDVVELEVRLAASPVALAPIVVNVDRRSIAGWLAARGFAGRGHDGRARAHLTHEQLRLKHYRNLTELLRNVPGLRVRQLVDEGSELVFDPDPRTGEGYCKVSVYLNGSNVEYGRFTASRNDRNESISRPMRFDDLVRMDAIDGLELYGPDDNPVAADGTCGTLMIWSARLRGAVDEHFTGDVRGTAIDEATGEFLAGVRVALEGTGLAATTDSNGTFVLRSVLPGRYTVTAQYPQARPWQTAIEVRAYGVVEVALRVQRDDRVRPRAR